MESYLISSIMVKKLWGFENFDISFRPDVNILIGENGSGKTTILNLLRYIFTADIEKLSDIDFEEVEIKVRSFDEKSKSIKTIKVVHIDRGFKFKISNKSFEVSSRAMRGLRSRAAEFQRLYQLSLFSEDDLDKLTQELDGLVPAAWLPVTRRLPIPDAEQESFELRKNPLESVDDRLRQLLSELSQYRLSLDTKLSERYKEFERQVLSIFLYNKKLDTFQTLKVETFVTEKEKQKLIQAFEQAGLLDKDMRRRIDEHFTEAENAVQRIQENFRESRNDVDVNDVMIIPLIMRTNNLIRLAEKLEDDRRELFKPLAKFREIVNSFLLNKEINISDSGNLEIISSHGLPRRFAAEKLASGEKQILILLTQALLKEDEPVVYVADEPELSLHVTWQEKLLASLLSLAGQIQIIVATHSPDIVGDFRENIIEFHSYKA